MDKDYDITPTIQHFLTKTSLTTKPVNDRDKSTVFDIIEKTDFYFKTQNKGLNSARMEDGLWELPKTKAKTPNLSLPLLPNENEEFEEEDSNDLQGERVKIIIPTNIFDFYTKF